ncbi:hypothetical protein SAMN05216503_1215 [Polaribacter sp. KT25b]|uniref:DUF7010 family protein n=1 Tax=Polaribacter sp. KT25b TaxID=1855336 RepID=UPI00087A2E93|nr:hypothetical protein [Polaribacter sp. KT25b]SDR86830.1 hypothetical protein SAMN05216503_1215 [Polaribacter sp. KT25b]
MTLLEAQKDMRNSYFGGAPGAFVSGFVWLASGITALINTQKISVLVFFFGGMIIHPLGMALCKALKRSGKHKKENPLANLALESTILLFIGLFIAYSILQIQANWFFSIMILIIGARYLIFNSLYGNKIYWIFGAVLILAGVLGILFSKYFYLIVIVGGIIEIIFSLIIFYLEKKTK